MLWDLYQQYRIEQLDERLDRMQTAEEEDAANRRAAVHLDEKVNRLALICRAMFELMQAAGGVTEEQLKAKIVEIEGRTSPQPKKCPKCGAMMSPQMDHCQFCGYVDGAGTPFR